MITVKYRGQTGNQLFQYAYARLLVDGSEHSLKSPPIAGFRELPDNIDGNSYPGGTISLFQNSHHPVVLYLSLVRDVVDGFDVSLECYFESASIFSDYRRIISEWFLAPRGDTDSVGIHVRGKDAKHISPPLSYYLDAMHGYFRTGPITIYTDDTEDDVVKDLAFRFSALVVSGGVREDFEAMRRHTTLIIGNSTFAWWAAFTSDPSHTIIQPEPTSGFRSRQVPNSCLLLPYWEQIKYEP